MVQEVSDLVLDALVFVSRRCAKDGDVFNSAAKLQDGLALFNASTNSECSLCLQGD